MAQATCKLSR